MPSIKPYCPAFQALAGMAGIPRMVGLAGLLCMPRMASMAGSP